MQMDSTSSKRKKCVLIEDEMEKVEMPKKKGNILLQRIQENYSLKQNRDFENPTGTDDLRIVILGKTGVGKSATANTILGKDVFKEDITTASVTQQSAGYTNVVNGRKVSVIDTPGLQDCDRPEEEILCEVARVVQMFREGIHVFIYILNMATPRFTEEDKNSMDKIETMFGGHMEAHRLLVYSHAESHLKNTMDLDRFLERQLSSGTVTAGHVKKFNSNIVAVNNRGAIKGERERNQNVILGMVDKIKQENNDAVYTNEYFRNAMAMWEKHKKHVLEKGCNVSISKTIEQVTSEYPETVKDFKMLKRKVREKIEEELQQLEEITFNYSMKEMKEETNLILTTAETEERKRKWKKEVEEITKKMKENKELVEREDFEEQIREIAQSHDNVFQRIYHYMKMKWDSIFK